MGAIKNSVGYATLITLIETSNLSPETKEKAIAGINKMKTNAQYRKDIRLRFNSQSLDINGSFTWYRTDEGIEFWRDVHFQTDF